MPTYVQADRPLTVATPLGKDMLLLTGLSGQEALSQLFSFQLDLMAENKTDVAFDKLLGQKVSVTLALPGNKKRYFSGLCSRISQGERGPDFTGYRMQVVPQFWLLTRVAQSRIFQHVSVPDILKKVLEGFDVDWQIQGSFQPRDYCVQYRETDFNFASRLLEEEGIYYFFKHTADGHKMIVANTPQSHPDVPEFPKAIYETIEGGGRLEDRVHEWEKAQELRSGKYTLWDHCFELPHKHLEAEKPIADSVQAGKVTHKLKVGDNGKLELYDYPGEYAQRFDGIDKGGGEQGSEVQKIFEDNKRTVEIRMQEEALASLQVQGAGSCRQFTSGHKFTLERHFNADGAYVLTSVRHTASLHTSYRSNGGSEFHYENTFTCIPFAASFPYRPPRRTPKPVVQGTQTAVVVGPGEIFTDKYSRIKVQFHWDRAGKHDANSSCWVRVGTMWAGKQWGMIHIPRVGQEVIVAFQEGDPDQPIVVGSVYNAEEMPPYALPGNKTMSGIKSRSSAGGSPANFNEISFEDKKGSEMVTIHAEKDQTIGVEHDESHWVGHDRKKNIDHDETTHVKHDRTETVDNNETITIGVNRTEKVGKDETITIGNDRKETVSGNETIAVAKNRTRTVSKNESVTVTLTRTHKVGINEAITVGAAQQVTVGAARTVTVGAVQKIKVGASQTMTIGANLTENVGKNHTDKVGKDRKTTIGDNDNLKVGKKLAIEAGDEITITTGQSSITMKKDGTITIKGKDITIEATSKIAEKAMNITSEASTKNLVKGSMVNVEADGVNTIKGSLVKIN